MAFVWHGDAVRQRIAQAAFRGVVKGTEAVHDLATQKIQSPPKTGRIYVRRGVKHQASAPGEAPATDTGRLVQSGKTSYQPGDLLGRVSWTTIYARTLELGSDYKLDPTKGAATAAIQLELGTQSIAPRPFARPSLMELHEEIQAGIGAEIGAVL